MSKEDQALIILEELDTIIQINWCMQKYYVKHIVAALNQIEEGEKA